MIKYVDLGGHLKASKSCMHQGRVRGLVFGARKPNP